MTSKHSETMINVYTYVCQRYAMYIKRSSLSEKLYNSKIAVIKTKLKAKWQLLA